MNLPLLNKEKIFKLLFKRFNGRFLTLKDLPHPHTFKDMQKAVKRVATAIKKREKIALIGDYDVDGVVATSIVRKFFQENGFELEWIIPNRFSDGYGISPKILERINAGVIITVDNGIAAIEAGNICKERGIDLIITDHHNIGTTLPQAFAIVNQKQNGCLFEFKEICGAQIAWYFIAALSSELQIQYNLKDLLAYVALAIIADIMPLNGINRVMLLAGMQLLNQKKYPFVEALKEVNNIKSIDSQTIGFYIAPLLNSAGRLSDAKIASEFLLSKSKEEALIFLEELNSLNTQRKALEQKITLQALDMVQNEDDFILVKGQEWNEGVVGIVAARLAKRFKKPTVVVTCKDGLCKGSGRSWGNCDLFTLMQEATALFEKFGGHKMAIGVSFREEKFETIKRLLNQKAKILCDNKDYIDDAVLGILPFKEVTLELFEMIKKFEPFGEANPAPKFISKNVEVLFVGSVGKNGEHKRYKLKEGKRILNAIEFRSSSHIEQGSKVDIIYTLQKNEFNNEISIDLYLDEINLTQ